MSVIRKKFERRAGAANSLLCVGLDADHRLLPQRFCSEEFPQFAFNRWIIEQTHEFACAYKPNTAFYEARGSKGWAELAMTARYLADTCPDVVTICDAKRADIGNTNRGYVEAVFDALGFDAITLHPYLGREALEPFLAREDKASIILCRTSNPGAGELQDLQIDGEPLWRRVAERVATEWNARGNCMLVVGATYPEEMRAVREVAPDVPLLVPGIGAQGGDVEVAVRAGVDAQGLGMIIASSRAILFSDEPKLAARAARDEINAAREKVHAAH